jgi:uncharacterized protein YacL
MDLIDKNSTSLFLGALVFALTFFILQSNYERISDRLEDHIEYNKYFDQKVYAIFISVSLFVSLLFMVFWKRYLVESGSKVYIDEPF